MTFALGARSLARLDGVHPDLVAVVKAAIGLSKVDFTVVEGCRSKEKMCENYGKGRTATECEAKGIPGSYAMPSLAKVTWLAHPLQSKHGVHEDGYGHAVDLAPWVDGKIDWDTVSNFDAIADAMKAAAAAHPLKIVWGGAWASSPDLPHWELP